MPSESSAQASVLSGARLWLVSPRDPCGTYRDMLLSAILAGKSFRAGGADPGQSLKVTSVQG